MPRLENGFVYLWALFSVMLAGVVMAGAAQLWQTKSQRQKEAELLFIGEEFRKAIMSYYNSGNKQFPDSLEDLLKDDRSPNIKRHLRKIYVDPITNTTEWGFIDESQANAANPSSPASGPNQASGTTQSGTHPTSGTGSTSGINPSSAANQATNTSLTPTSGQTANTANPANNPGATSNNPSNKSSPPSSSSGMSSSISKRIAGVYRLSEKKPIKKDQFPEHIAKFSEAQTYMDWQFIYKPGSETKPGSGTGAGAGATTKPGAQNSPFSSPSSRGGAPASSSSSGNASSPFASPSQSGASKGGTSPFSRSSADSDDD